MAITKNKNKKQVYKTKKNSHMNGGVFGALGNLLTPRTHNNNNNNIIWVKDHNHDFDMIWKGKFIERINNIIKHVTPPKDKAHYQRFVNFITHSNVNIKNIESYIIHGLPAIPDIKKRIEREANEIYESLVEENNTSINAFFLEHNRSIYITESVLIKSTVRNIIAELFSNMIGTQEEQNEIRFIILNTYIHNIKALNKKLQEIRVEGIIKYFTSNFNGLEIDTIIGIKAILKDKPKEVFNYIYRYVIKPSTSYNTQERSVYEVMIRNLGSMKKHQVSFVQDRLTTLLYEAASVANTFPGIPRNSSLNICNVIQGLQTNNSFNNSTQRQLTQIGRQTNNSEFNISNDNNYTTPPSSTTPSSI
jgi:hypothetical protein